MLTEAADVKEWEKQERSTARRYGGRVTPGSGNQWHTKNDVRTGTESLECKTTKSAQFTLRRADLFTASRNALLDSRRMVFQIQFEKYRERYVVLTEDDYLELRGNEAEN